MKGPPPRLLVDPATPVELRTDLMRVARTAHEYDAADGLSKFQRSVKTLDAGASADLADGALHAGTSAGSSAAAAWAAKTVVVALLGTGAWTAWTRWQERTLQPAAYPPPSAAAPAQHAAPIEAPAPLPTPALDVAGPVSAATPDERPSAPQRPAAHREIEQLEQVKAWLATDPAAAYRLAQQSAREFPNGVLREEREGLSVLALWRLGKHVRAREKAAQFLERYPQSPLRARIEGLAAPSE